MRRLSNNFGKESGTPPRLLCVPEPQLILVKVINVTNSNRRWCGTRPTIRVPMWSWLGVLTVAFADGPTRFCGKSENLYMVQAVTSDAVR